MALIEFKNLPDTNTPINAENLNHNFNSVVESGSNDNGEWIKYADGTMICTKNILVTSASVSSAWGSIYYYQDVNEHYFAQPFVNTPKNFQLTFRPSTPSGCWLGEYGITQTTKSYFKNFSLLRPTSGTVSGNLFVIAIGRWK